MTAITEAEISRQLGNQFWFVEYGPDGMKVMERTAEQAKDKDWKLQKHSAGLNGAASREDRKPRVVMTEADAKAIYDRRLAGERWNDIMAQYPEYSRKAAIQRCLKLCRTLGLSRPARAPAKYKQWPPDLRERIDAMRKTGMGAKKIGASLGLGRGTMEAYFEWCRSDRP